MGLPNLNSVYLGRPFWLEFQPHSDIRQIKSSLSCGHNTKPQKNKGVLENFVGMPKTEKGLFPFYQIQSGTKPFLIFDNSKPRGRQDFVGMDFRRPVQPQHPALRAPVTPKPLFPKKTQHKSVWPGWQNYFFSKSSFGRLCLNASKCLSYQYLK